MSSLLPLGRRLPGRRARRAALRPIVEFLEQKALLATFTVTSNADAGAGSLRQAILDANEAAGQDMIRFNLPAGQTTITLGSALPRLTDSVVIDGTTQPGYPNEQGGPIVEVAGAPGTDTGSGDGFVIAAGNTTIRGLAINRFSGNGITIVNPPGGSVTNNRIQNNYIGTGIDGATDRGNGGHGILIQGSSGNLIGGEPIRGNTIGFNGEGPTFNGITIVGLAPTAINNRITYNAIFGSGGLGIDLGGNGVTPNDLTPVPDADTGPNTLQNYPEITSVTTIEQIGRPPRTVINAALRSTPNTTFLVQYFDNDEANASGFGEGQRPVLIRRVTTDASGVVSFSDTLTDPLAADGFLTATATSPSGNTSEFSQAVQIQLLSELVDIGVTVVDAPDPVEAGQPLTYVATIRNFNPRTPSAPAEVVVRLPEGVVLAPDGVSVSVGTFEIDGDVIRARFGPLPGGRAETLTLVVLPGQAGILQATFIASGGIADFNPLNNQATAVTQVNLSPTTPVVSFRIRDFTVAEAGGLATVEVVRSNQLAGTVSVDYRTVDESAIAGAHYVATSGTLTFGPNELTKTFTIPIIDNDTIDPNRTVRLELSGPTGGAIIGVPSRASLTIFDDDPPAPVPQFLQFSEARVSILENQGPAVLTVRRTGSTAGVVSIPFATSPGTALAGRDYEAVSGTLTFNSGESEKTIPVPIIDNDRVDGSRSFFVALGSGTGAAAGPVSRVEVTIVDDESPLLGTFQFASAVFAANEADGLATITVTRTGGIGPATVAFTTVPGTAEAGVRYRPTSGILEFGPDDTQKTFTVELIPTPSFIGAQTVFLELGAPPGTAIGPVGRATLTIFDAQDPPPSLFQFDSRAVFVDESAGVAILTVNRLGPAQGTASIGVATFGGDAIPGVHYQPIAVRLVFGPGETSKTVAIPIIDNTIVDPDRGLAVWLGFPEGNAVIGEIDATAVIILNNDRDLVPPTIVDVQAVGSAGPISALSVFFSKPMAPGAVLSTANYSVVALGRDGVFGTADDRAIPIAGLGRTPDGLAVSIAFATPVPAGEFVAIGINGGPGGLTDLSGNLIDGNDDGAAGGSFSTVLTRAQRLSYRDADGDLITYTVTGGGGVELIRGAPGTGDVVRVVGAVPGRSVLRGQVVRGRGGDGLALIRRIDGIDPFGRVRSALRTPPFVDLSQITPAAVDALIAGQARRR